MLKFDAINLLGGTVVAAADAVGITAAAISQWPDELPPRLVDRVLAALVRKRPDDWHLIWPELATPLPATEDVATGA